MSTVPLDVTAGSTIGPFLPPPSSRRWTWCVTTVSGGLTRRWPLCLARSFLVWSSGSLLTCLELVGSSKRSLVGYGYVTFWAFGELILIAVAFFVRGWQTMQLSISSLTVLFLTYFWLIPESPRWFLNKKRYSDAEAIFRQAARVNKVKLPERAFDWNLLSDDKTPQEPVWRVLRYPRLLVRTLIICFNWFTCGMMFFGLTLNVGSLSGDIYLNFLLYVVMEFCSYIICAVALNRIGRKALHCTLMLTGGVACVTSPLPVVFGGGAYNWLTISLAMVGKFAVSGAFATMYIFSSELFPTVIRNSGVSAGSLSARIGSSVAPYVANLSTTVRGDAGRILPFAIFGSLFLTAGLVSLILPETKNKKLPDTLQDADSIGRKTSDCKNRFDMEVAIPLTERQSEDNAMTNRK